jgi:hypothetical protein
MKICNLPGYACVLNEHEFGKRQTTFYAACNVNNRYICSGVRSSMTTQNAKWVAITLTWLLILVSFGPVTARAAYSQTRADFAGTTKNEQPLPLSELLLEQMEENRGEKDLVEPLEAKLRYQLLHTIQRVYPVKESSSYVHTRPTLHLFILYCVLRTGDDG